MLPFLLLLLLVLPVGAQESPAAQPTGLCRPIACRLVLDWGSGSTAAGLPVDRRYGSPNDFESLLAAGLQEAGMRVTAAGEGPQLLLRIGMKNAMCDAMPGTNTDMSCRTIDEVQVQWTLVEGDRSTPGSTRVMNRCGAGDQKMTIPQMAAFTAASILYQSAADRKGLKRPSARC